MIHLRICFLCQALDTLGGLQRAVVLLANELVSRGVHVSVLMDRPELKGNPYGLSEGVEVLRAGEASRASVFPRYISKVRRHSGFPRPSLCGKRLPGSVISSDAFDAVSTCFVAGQFDYVVGCDPLHTIVAAYACDRLETKVCGWQHSTYDGYFNQRGRGFFGLDGLYGKAVGKCAVNFVLTDESRKIYEAKTGRAATVLPNSITSLGQRSSADSCVLYCGRLDPGSKGADYLPAIALGLAEAGFAGRFEVVGEGSYGNELERWVAGVNLPFEMVLTGFVSNAEAYYSHASVLISPSRWEGFGLSILEGMAHGVPCVAFDNDGPRSIITDGADGFIVPKGSTSLLVDTVMRLLNDGDLRSRMAEQAIRTARNYLVASQADKFLAALEECER